MPRYLVQRHFTDGLHIPVDAEGAKSCSTVVHSNAELGVTWVHSYVSIDKSVTYCVYDGPSEDAIRRAADASGLPADQVTEVRVLDPYFYH
ncbi:hypothetical protein AQI88_41665 [Streptomyces cellostaticus]|uniref:DUF4242 domain-containing protein n=1 Tax=Streptomyces cellostaticus TaxID=67285 RepID=A0A101N217_9ACTN|nr:DUF4242 domain-containing protein [Streptomyces cellostaticus]KUM85096.1 hypothetical protein AQI88_41665 [Streptomyces cellostaticus]GHI10072.1 hypothetical protein Scel_83930 [Streptomyces cellostaticus]